MSERERWIVYPLLFFALGAAIRDKLLQRIDAKEIVCESLRIVDERHPRQPLAELAFQRTGRNAPAHLGERFGMLRLYNSDGHDICSIAGDMLIDRVFAERLVVVDETQRARVQILTEPVPGFAIGDAEPPVSYQGVIYLNNQPINMRIAPPPAPAAQPSE